MGLVFDGMVLITMKLRRLHGNRVEFDGRTVLGSGRKYTKWKIHKRVSFVKDVEIVRWDGPILFKYPVFQGIQLTYDEVKDYLMQQMNSCKNIMLCIHGFNPLLMPENHLKFRNDQQQSSENEMLIIPIIWPPVGGLRNKLKDYIRNSEISGTALTTVEKNVSAELFPKVSLIKIYFEYNSSQDYSVNFP